MHHTPPRHSRSPRCAPCSSSTSSTTPQNSIRSEGYPFPVKSQKASFVSFFSFPFRQVKTTYIYSGDFSGIFLMIETSLVFARLFSLNSVDIRCFLEFNVLATIKNLSSKILGNDSFACSSMQQMQNPWNQCTKSRSLMGKDKV